MKGICVSLALLLASTAARAADELVDELGPGLGRALNVDLEGGGLDAQSLDPMSGPVLETRPGRERLPLPMPSLGQGDGLELATQPLDPFDDRGLAMAPTPSPFEAALQSAFEESLGVVRPRYRSSGTRSVAVSRGAAVGLDIPESAQRYGLADLPALHPALMERLGLVVLPADDGAHEVFGVSGQRRVWARTYEGPQGYVLLGVLNGLADDPAFEPLADAWDNARDGRPVPGVAVTSVGGAPALEQQQPGVRDALVMFGDDHALVVRVAGPLADDSIESQAVLAGVTIPEWMKAADAAALDAALVAPSAQALSLGAMPGSFTVTSAISSPMPAAALQAAFEADRASATASARRAVRTGHAAIGARPAVVLSYQTVGGAYVRSYHAATETAQYAVVVLSGTHAIEPSMADAFVAGARLAVPAASLDLLSGAGPTPGGEASPYGPASLGYGTGGLFAAYEPLATKGFLITGLQLGRIVNPEGSDEDGGLDLFAHGRYQLPMQFVPNLTTEVSAGLHYGIAGVSAIGVGLRAAGTYRVAGAFSVWAALQSQHYANPEVNGTWLALSLGVAYRP